MPDLETKSLIGVEVFAVGEWNGDKWTSKDLDTLVDAFDATKAALRPYIKLGHGDRQVLLERDSLPAAGWIDRLYRAGNKLLADISGIPGKLHAILKAGGYKRVSAEVFIRPKVDGKIYEKALKAVSFLGGETPAVSNLNDILAAYGRDVPKTDQEAEIKVYEVQTDGRHTEETNMAEIELRILTGQCLDRRIPDRQTLSREVTAWEQGRNAGDHPIHWRFTTADARIKLRRLYPKF